MQGRDGLLRIHAFGPGADVVDRILERRPLAA